MLVLDGGLPSPKYANWLNYAYTLNSQIIIIQSRIYNVFCASNESCSAFFNESEYETSIQNWLQTSV